MKTTIKLILLSLSLVCGTICNAQSYDYLESPPVSKNYNVILRNVNDTTKQFIASFIIASHSPENPLPLKLDALFEVFPFDFAIEKGKVGVKIPTTGGIQGGWVSLDTYTKYIVLVYSALYQPEFAEKAFKCLSLYGKSDFTLDMLKHPELLDTSEIINIIKTIIRNMMILSKEEHGTLDPISSSKSDGPDEPEPQKFTETVSGVKFDMVFVKGGTFMMGATDEQGTEDPISSEYPVHEVTLSDYYIGKFEVTQELWEKVMGNNPSKFQNGNNYPVEMVSWNDIQEFLEELNRLTGKKYALPTEAQWEYAARGGAKSKGYKYSGSNTVGDVAWNADNSDDDIHPVGKKQANELGLYDMSGNVWEWCSDWMVSYNSEPQTNPVGPATGSYRVLCGGGWNDNAGDCRVSRRDFGNPGYRDFNVGFRVVLLP